MLSIASCLVAGFGLDFSVWFVSGYERGSVVSQYIGPLRVSDQTLKLILTLTLHPASSASDYTSALVRES